jgi:isoquinoline 1-oxidoreductase subunit beta
MSVNEVRSIPLLNGLRRFVGAMFRKGDLTPPAKLKGRAKPHLWFDIPPSGPVILYSPKAEMGQGIFTVLAQIACEELSLLPHQIVVVPTPTEKKNRGRARARDFGSMSRTAGSTSVKDIYQPLRLSSAALKHMLLIEAAAQFGVGRDAVVAQDGNIFVAADPSRTRTYGDIVMKSATPLSDWDARKINPRLKPASEFRVIGHEFPRVDAVAKVRGTAQYGYDALLPGTLFGAVAHPPRYGASIRSVNTTAAESMPGVVKIVVEPAHNFLGVVAETRTKAWAAIERIDVEWDGGTTWSDTDIATELRRKGGAVLINRGDAVGTLKKATTAISAEYSTCAVAHAHLEPVGALAHVTSERTEVWVPTQQPSSVAAAVQRAIGSRSVVVNPTFLGSGFGRKFMVHAATEAARLSKAVGKPVHLGWTSQQDLQFGPFRPPTVTKFAGAVSANRVVAIDQFNATGDVIAFPKAAQKLLAFHPGAQNGLDLPYVVPNYRMAARLANLPIPTGIWRGVGLLPNVFAAECFIDELADAAKIDPLRFRLDHMPTDEIGRNLSRLLTEVAKRAEWDRPLAPRHGRGIACCGMSGSLIATVVEVAVNDGVIAVERVVVCVDPGLVINPAGAKLQIVGGVMMGISSALCEKITFSNGMSNQRSLEEYELLGARQAPIVDVYLMGTGDVPAGLGEPGVGPVAAAIGNAVFDATGQRLRSLPFSLPRGDNQQTLETCDATI